MSEEQILLDGLFEKTDPLCGITADEVGPEIAAALNIPLKPGPQAQTLTCGYALMSLEELLAQSNTPIDYLVDGRLVAGTVSAIVAKPKVGKSTLARNLALCVSTGKPFLGATTRQGEVIYLALEERAEEIKFDFAAMGAVGNEPICIHAANAPEDAVPRLAKLVAERRPALVIVDPLFRLARIRDEKAYAEVYTALGPFIDLARETGTHVTFTHHAGKGLKTDAIDAPLGSTALGGAVSTLLFIKRGESYRTLQTVQRTGIDLPETVLLFDSPTRTLFLGATKSEAEEAEAQKRILEYLKHSTRAKSQEEIREDVEGRTQVIRAALTALVRNGEVQKSGRGGKGNPFLYEFRFSGSQHSAGTTEPQSLSALKDPVAFDDIVVPENSGKRMVVPASSDNFEAEHGELRL